MIFLILAIAVLVFSIVAYKACDNKFIPVVSTIAGAVLLVLSFVSYVPTGHTGIVTTFGKVHDVTLDAGIHFKAPWNSVLTMDNREQKKPFQLEAFSKDIQQVDVQGSVNYNIDKATAMNLYKDVGTDYADILIGPRIQEDIKIVIAKYTAENLIENRQAMSDEIFELLKDELAPKGINIISLAIENIDFTDAFEAAVEAKQVATQEKQKAKTQQEQRTMEAEQKAERDRIAAQAAADVEKIGVDAEAYAIKTRSDAEAEANKKIAESLTEELIRYSEVNQWNGQLPSYVGTSSAVPIINTNTK